MRTLFWIAALGCLLAVVAPAAAATPSPHSSASGQPYVLEHAEQRLMTASGSGRRYQVSIAVPQQPAPDGGYPVIYVLDGNAMFLTAVEAVRAWARRRDDGAPPQALVVGIGYPPGSDIPAERTFDFTPPLADMRGPYRTGGRDDFAAFIVDDLKPVVARDYPVDPQRQALIGHSLAGLFVLGTLTRQPEVFQTWVAMSGSFWFGGHAIVPRIAGFAAERSADAGLERVLLTVGEYEEKVHPAAWARNPERAARMLEELGRRGQVTHARGTAERLAAAPGMLVDFVEIAGEDHGSVVPAAISRAVAFFLAGPSVVPGVPTGQEYLDLGADGRYRLRMQVRALPDLHRIPWLNGLKASLQQLDQPTREMLHGERQAMDERHGSRPHAVNAD